MDNITRFTDNKLFEIAYNGFSSEVGILARIADAQNFRQLLENFENYPKFLSSHIHDFFGSRFYDELNNLKTIDFNKPTKDLLLLTNAINLAAACDLFTGWNLHLDKLQTDSLIDQLEHSIKDISKSKGQAAQILARKLNSGDASRVIHMLKLFGWIAPDMTNTQQLSLGASGGTRDRHSIHHQIPALRYQRHNPLLREPLPEMVSFNVEQQTATDIVLVDNDPKMHHRYHKLNEEPNILALNLDANNALDEIKNRIDNCLLAPRRFVLAFRIDHQMIPDAADFLHRLGSVIDETADLVVTIGAGHNISEFRGRLDKIDELIVSLTDLGLNPVKIRWHHGKTLSEQRNNPIFGAPAYATYEILYCKLAKSAFST